MKYSVTRFKSLVVALKELRPFILNGHHLQTGKGFKGLNDMRSREALSNWLLCVAINSITTPRRMNFTSAPDSVGGDGVIYDEVLGVGIVTEHIVIPQRPRNLGRDAGDLILEAILQKVAKGGAAYAVGKTLVVFLLQGAEEWWPNKVARQLPNPLHFEDVWITGLHGVVQGRYVYNVTRLANNSPAWRIWINENFDGWDVEGVQGLFASGYIASMHRFACSSELAWCPRIENWRLNQD